MIEKTSDIEAAIHEMKEDNGRAKPRKESNPNFRSFPARQNINTGRVSQPTASRTRPTPRQRFETRPTVSPTQQDFAPTESFQGFDFSKPAIQQRPVSLVTEAPRSTFQLDQNFQGINQNVIAEQQIIAARPVQPAPQINNSPQPSAAVQPQATPLPPQVPAITQHHRLIIPPSLLQLFSPKQLPFLHKSQQLHSNSKQVHNKSCLKIHSIF